MSSDHNVPSPEALTQQYDLPMMHALINFDLHDPEPQVLGCDPLDLSGIPTEPVKTIAIPGALVTIYAHQGEGQDVADLLSADPSLVSMVQDHGEQYFYLGVISFDVHALTPHEIDNVRQRTGNVVLEIESDHQPRNHAATPSQPSEEVERDSFPIVITSAEDLPRQHAPEAYRPHMQNGPCVYEDEYATIPIIPLWRQDYAGGSNRPHWVLIDRFHEPHIVETSGWGGNYDVSSSDYHEHFENAYDAFWIAEQRAEIYTDPAMPQSS